MFLCEACYQIHSDEQLGAVGAFTGFDRVRMSWPYWIKSFFWRGAHRLGYGHRRGHRDAWLGYELPPDPEWFPTEPRFTSVTILTSRKHCR